MINDKEFEELLNNYYYSHKLGDIIQGEIIGIEKDSLLVDIKSKAVAICPSSETILTKNEKLSDSFKIGEVCEFAINSCENDDGIFYLSHRKVALAKNIGILKEKQEKNETVKGIITNISKGGVLVNVLGVKGFVPTSHLRAEEKIGQVIDLKVLTINPQENNFIFSNKKVYDDQLETIKKDIFEKVELNMVIKGTVVRLTDFGAFVDIGGIDGLLPLSQISWKWIDNPNDIFECGQKIDVEIIGIDKEKQRISLSYKSLSENPWPKAKEFVGENKEVKGKVTRIKPFGAFVEIYPQVEGLLNRQQIKEYFNKHKKDIQENDEILVGIKKLDVENQKINLEVV